MNPNMFPVVRKSRKYQKRMIWYDTNEIQTVPKFDTKNVPPV